jgi:hypothetical protein
MVLATQALLEVALGERARRQASALRLGCQALANTGAEAKREVVGDRHRNDCITS